MLSWLSEADSLHDDEAPETPAPVFAVRAFKTALFGTPAAGQTHTGKENKVGSEEQTTIKRSPRLGITTPKTSNNSHTSRSQKVKSLVSPAKGILLTPGTAAARRKTVSFSSLKPNGEDHKDDIQKSSLESVAESDENAQRTSETESKDAGDKPAGLTKDSFEAQLDASKQRLSSLSQHSDRTSKSVRLTSDVPNAATAVTKLDTTDNTAEITVDLTKPRSKSGQHWKAEYERYQSQSDRELRRVLQRGQHVKSFAEKKDSEATILQNKLGRELAKCADMERKVSKLATELANSKHQDSKATIDQESLMNELSQQTTLAVKYKQKADRYRIAIQQQKTLRQHHDCVEEPSVTEDLIVDLASAATKGSAIAEVDDKRSQLDDLRVELQNLQAKLSNAEERAARLEARNAKLTKNFLRVKDEMLNYDDRRIRKETMLKQREERLAAELNTCNTRLSRVIEENALLKQSLGDQSVGKNASELIPRIEANRESLDEHRIPLSQTNQCEQRSLHPKKATSNGPSIDIWTMESPTSTSEVAPPAAEPAINLSSVAISEATHNALREIDQNSLSEYPPEPPDTPRHTLQHLATMDSSLQPDFLSSSGAYPSSAVKRMNDRKTTMASPRPSMVSMLSSAVKVQDTPRADGWRRGASLASSRRSTMMSGRSRAGDLPPERAAAAKARLAQRANLKQKG
ncbi:MAG: hypothetical protein Q9220_004540 [cf. Caloplaca sp. 1 TL-2023]